MAQTPVTDQSGPAPPVGGDPAGRARLARALVRGVAWVGAFKWATQIFSWAATLVIARILTPADYGLLTMATVYLGLVQIVNEFGLGTAIIRQRDLTEDQIAALGGLSIAFGAALWGLSVVAAIPIARFYDEPAVRGVISALGVTFLTTAVRVLPRALLTRDLKFKRVAAIDAVDMTTATIMTLALAVLGWRYWSLVYGGIVGSVAATALALYWQPHRRHLPRRLDAVMPSLRFGWHLVVSRLAWYLYTSADFAVVGRLFDKTILGGYSFAWTLASIPVTRISGLVGQVVPAILATVQTEPAELRRYFLKLTEGLAFVTLPFSVGVALVAADFVLVALGEHWRSAIVPLQLLAIYAAFRSLTTLHAQILVATGRSAEQMNYSLLALFVLPPLFYLGGKLGGAPGVAWAWIVGYPLVMIPPFRKVFQVTEATAAQYLAALWPSVLGCLIMAGVVLGLRSILPPSMPALGRLVTESAAGASTYGVFVIGFQRKRFDAFVAMLRELKR